MSVPAPQTDPDRISDLSRRETRIDEPFRSRVGRLKRFGREFLLPHARNLVVAVLAMSVFAGTVVALPWLFKSLVNDILVRRDAGALYEIVGVVLVLFGLRAAAGYLQQYMLSRVSNHVTTSLQNRISNHLLGLDLAFFQKNSVGQIIARATDDVNVLNNTSTNIVVTLGRDLVTFVGLVIYVLWASPQWFLLALAGGPLIAIPAVIANRKLRALMRHGQQLGGEILQAFEEALHGIRGVKAENHEDVERKRLRDVIVGRRKIGLKVARTRAALSPIVDVVTALALVGVLLVGGSQVIDGSSDAGELMAFVSALMLLYEPLRRLLQVNAQLQICGVSIARIYEILDRRPRIVDAAGAVALADPSGAIVFDDVRFGYDPAKPVLDGFSVTIPAGASIAFVGPSGSGKTTVLNLVARLYEPSGGRVTIGGQDIAGVTLASLRESIALVSQDVLLFDASVRANIAYGRPDATDAEIEAAARAAMAHEFIERLEGGYGFRVGPRGTRLSGGQRQRVAIARALLRNAPILLLDEATSALDGAIEAQVQANIFAARKNRTTLIIAHRLATVVAADLICVVRDGRVVEQGDHRTLLGDDGEYAESHRLQSG
ncbi:ABC transporter ATP-binding protein [Methylopila sp. Yamaguchi]|uniref:ABC transporter ATP-binding protein n=1 Tax=Methylopila sp. Yamaguchi TaxID=1437817 RepID=UPI000CA787EF|nr:ABC transporter ATP-binding protein [Methylopila sp. Yamaguchi]GBD48498.1 lipid A export ATP-binding protein [Methylopila sp. Yamaguchi]